MADSEEVSHMKRIKEIHSSDDEFYSLYTETYLKDTLSRVSFLYGRMFQGGESVSKTDRAGSIPVAYAN